MTPAVTGRFRTAQDKVTRQSVGPVLGLLASVPVGVPLTDEQWARLLALLMPSVLTGRQTARDLAADMYRTVAPAARAPDIPVRPYDVAALSSTLSQGIDLDRGLSVREKLTDPVTRTQGVVLGASAVGRHIELAGRDYVRQATYADEDAVGWARVARGSKTCAWCLMLVSRGPVYHTGATAGLNDDGSMNRWHNACDCQAVPVHDELDWPGIEQYQQAEELWKATTGPFVGQDKLNAFRRAVETRRSPQAAKVAEIVAAVPSAVEPPDVPEADMEAALAAAIESEDWDRFEELSAESDRRDAKRAESEARSERRRQQKDRERQAQLDVMSELIEQGVPEAEAYAEAYGVTVDQAKRLQVIESLRSAGYQGSSFEKLARASYADHVAREWLRAEGDCRGELLNRQGRARGVDDRGLFSGPLSTALKYASEELIEWWEQNERVTFDGWVAQLMGDSATLSTQRSTARVSSR